jgi:IS4 transposase
LQKFPYRRFHIPADDQPAGIIVWQGRIEALKHIQRMPMVLANPTRFRASCATIAALQARCWQIELFFRWIKISLRIKNSYGFGDHAVKTKIRVVFHIHIRGAIVKKKLHLEPSFLRNSRDFERHP